MESGAWNRTLPPLPGELSYYSTDSDDRRYVAVARSRSFSHFSTFAIEKQVLSSRGMRSLRVSSCRRKKGRIMKKLLEITIDQRSNHPGPGPASHLFQLDIAALVQRTVFGTIS
eukprot:292641-Rhodomonas_salina.2